MIIFSAIFEQNSNTGKFWHSWDKRHIFKKNEQNLIFNLTNVKSVHAVTLLCNFWPNRVTLLLIALHI